MIITDSSIGMDSARKYTSVSTEAFMRSRSVNIISANALAGNLEANATNKNSKGNASSKNSDENTFAKNLEETYKRNSNADSPEKLDKSEDTEKSKKEKNKDNGLSGNMNSNMEYLTGKFNEIRTAKALAPVKQEEDLRSAIRFICFNLLLVLLFGKNGADKLEDLLGTGDGSGDMMNGNNPFGGGLIGPQDIQFQEVTDRFEYTHIESEFEGTMFSANGVVKTSDGKEIDINIDLMMSRRFERVISETESYTSFSARLCDPLVINLDAPAAEVSDQKFYFDIDSDGIEDEVSMLSARSGFLALDLNDDGKINDGSELFGTKSGDGFADLAKYDSDGNGWIDEADEVFDKLKIFCVNDDGTTSLYKIKDKGVGAIYLGNKETEFSVTNAENMLNAQIRKTGLFLYETGGVGTVQHVDLNVELGA